MHFPKAKGLIVLLWILLCFRSFTVSYQDNACKNIIRSDGIGYFIWLPAILKYHDADLKFMDTVFAKQEPYSKGYQSFYAFTDSSSQFNKYPPGMALTHFPFYSLADIFGKFTGRNSGHEIHYQIAWQCGTLIWILIGMFSLLAISRSYGTEIRYSLLLLILLLFGTNLFQFATFDVMLSHGTSFGLVSLLLYLVNQGIRQSNRFNFFFAGIVAGTILAVRPANLLILPAALLPFILHNGGTTRADMIKAVIRMISGMIPPILFLLFTWHWHSGKWLLYSYGKETFNFGNPQFLRYLFGYESGLITYHPLVLLIFLLSSAALLLRKKILAFLLFAAILLCNSWILSCWHDPSFGCGLGNRPFTDYLPVLLFPLLALPATMNNWQYLLTGIPGILCLLYQQTLSFQYRHHIIDWCNMDKEKFWDVFLRTSPEYAYYTWPEWDFSQYRDQRTETEKHIPLEDSVLRDVHSNYSASDIVKIQGIKSLRIRQGNESNDLFHVTPKINQHGRRDYLNIRFRALFTQRTEARLNVYLNRNGEYVDLNTGFLKKQLREAGKWYWYERNIFIPRNRDSLDVRVWVSSAADAKLYLDSIVIRQISISDDQFSP